MSVKHVKAYYDEVCEQYRDLVNELEDFTEEANMGIIAPERLEQIKSNIQPLMNNYERLSYIMYLLNKPERKKKHKRYDKQSAKRLSGIKPENTQAGVVSENYKVLDQITR